MNQSKCTGSHLDLSPSSLDMNRLFGNKTATPKPGLTEAIASTEARADGVTQKIKKLDQELSRYRDQMKKMGSGPGKVSR